MNILIFNRAGVISVKPRSVTGIFIKLHLLYTPVSCIMPINGYWWIVPPYFFNPANPLYPEGDVLRCYLHLLIHEAMKMQDISTYVPQKNASQRTAELFLTLLERQFPIDIPNNTLTLKTANDYASRLSVHVNHLNRVVKTTTGRTTSTLITNRVIQEGLQLLQHSNHSVSEIAFALGFEEPASFSNFIRKHTDLSPTAYRSLQAV